MTSSPQAVDLLATLADIAPDSSLARARHTRQAATEHSQGSYDALFNSNENLQDFPLAERLLLAQQIARWHNDIQLGAHYAERLNALKSQNDTPRGHYSAALAHAERLSFKPAHATAGHLQELVEAGWSLDGIVTLSQLVAFVAFQSRLLRGYRLINGHTVVDNGDFPVGASFWRTDATTHSGKQAPKAFTQDELSWEPWIAPKSFAAFTPEQQATLTRFGHADSDYFRLLGRNLPVLEQRTLTDKGIFFTSGGLPRQDRELAAAVASKINGCIFCASVHARKAAQLSKNPQAVQRLLDTAPGDIPSHDQEARWQAEIAFSAALSATPANANARHIAGLRELGLSDLELLDLVQSTAFFAWANRLMLTLGEPFIPS
ncbi:alkylhydroperoxidase domain protein [Rouxiella chamberiensis]|uniref:Alkylhydroperoxidase domain protein n=1 Tax=Rouxiella chamberiensis TaxID=1513468 RepID=A0ABY7HUS9_9GAMM|nr:alkylhydroperoxidase domain protein [Rouxiella chamberiensis]WAT02561.1 alkylhydroperoxidase domain protein [Rouxiella chamberiensis]